MLEGLKGKTVLVTGAAGGIGQAACARFLREGANVVAADLDTAALDFPPESNIVLVNADLTRKADVDACVMAAVDAFGGLDLALLNAGVECRAAPVTAFSEAEYDRVFDVNVRASFLCAQAVVTHFLQSGQPGGVLFTASIAGLQGSPTTSIYNASKHAVVGLSKSLALEVGGQRVRVNVLCPGMVNTRMMRSLENSMGAAAGVDEAAMRATMVEGSLLGRYAEATEVASMAAWILSDEAPYAHGEIFTIGGGLMA